MEKFNLKIDGSLSSLADNVLFILKASNSDSKVSNYSITLASRNIASVVQDLLQLTATLRKLVITHNHSLFNKLLNQREALLVCDELNEMNEELSGLMNSR